MPSRLRALGPALALLAALAPPASAADIGLPGPLPHIHIRDNLQCQIHRAGWTNPAFFPGSGTYGRCGTFVGIIGSTGPTATFGPDSARIPAGAFTPPVAPYVLVSQSPVTTPIPGSRCVLTEVQAGPVLARLHSCHRAADAYYKQHIYLTNTTASPVTATVYHGGDCYVRDSDFGWGDVGPNRAYCTSAPNDITTPGSFMGFRAQALQGNRFLEGDVLMVVDRVNHAPFFDNTCLPACGAFVDNAAGVSFTFTVPANATRSRPWTTMF